MAYKYTESDPDVWIKRETTDKGTSYYKYMLVYVGNLLHLAKYAQEHMLNINQVYLLKGGFEPPDIYLCANVDKVQSYYRRAIWSMTCVEYL